MQSYSLDLRQRIVAAVEGGESTKEVAECRLFVVDGNAHNLAARPSQLRDLQGGRSSVGGVGHGLHHHGMVPADPNVAHLDRY